jgi:hypothetical protein
MGDEATGPLVLPDYVRPDGGEEKASVNAVDIAVFIDAGVPIAAARSSYHEAAFGKAGDGRLTMQLVKSQERPIATSSSPGRSRPRTPRARRCSRRRVAMTDYALLMVVPPQPTPAERAAFQQLPREVILVIDTSGSMQGAAWSRRAPRCSWRSTPSPRAIASTCSSSTRSRARSTRRAAGHPRHDGHGARLGEAPQGRGRDRDGARRSPSRSTRATRPATCAR